MNTQPASDTDSQGRGRPSLTMPDDYDYLPDMRVYRYERSPRVSEEVILTPLAERLPVIELIEFRRWDLVQQLARHSHDDLFHLDHFPSGAGVYWVGDTPNPIEQEAFYFIPPNVPHQLKITPGEKTAHLSIKFRYPLISPGFLPRVVQADEEVAMKVDALLRQCANLLFDEPRQTLPASLMLAQALAILHHFCHETPETLGEHRLVVAARKYMTDNFAERLSLDDIARAAGVGGPHLCRVFKKETGETPFEFLRRTRLNYAKQWLFQTREKLSHIATVTGFGATQEMNRAFQKLEGMSPREYRKRMTGNGKA